MTDTPAKKYGPAKWSESVRTGIYKSISDNNDKPVTQDVVDGWNQNFARLAKLFRGDHEALVADMKKSAT